MKNTNTRIISFVLTLFLTSKVVFAQDDVLKELQKIAIIEQKVMMPMRDGVRLASDVYRPKTEKKFLLFFPKLLIISIPGEMVK